MDKPLALYQGVQNSIPGSCSLSDETLSRGPISSYDLSCSGPEVRISKGAKIRNQYNQVPHLTQDTIGKVTNSQLDTTNKSQEVSPFPAGDFFHTQLDQLNTKFILLINVKMPTIVVAF